MRFKLIPLKESFWKKLNLPGSKSDSNRALIISSLCSEKSILSNFSPSDDTEVLIEALGKFGVKIRKLRDSSLEICGVGRNIEFVKKKNNLITVNLKKAGTAVRFFYCFCKPFSGYNKN